MLEEYKTKTNIGVGLGIVCQLIGRSLSDTSPGLGSIVMLAGTALFIYGCFSYATAKGHPSWYGLLGFLSIIGLIVLVILPDNHK